MAYITAYSAQFTSLAGVAWRVEIGLPDYQDRPVEISLDRDEPVIIEWPETSVSDAVQASVCTVKVVNDTDRQMMALMRGNALCSVYRDESLYWRGLIDDSVYEEPYSYTDGYVTEITFSDLGVLNRMEYTPQGVRSLEHVVSGMLDQAGLGALPFQQLFALKDGDGGLVTLGDLYVNTDRFSGMKPMEVLDGILRALDLRVMQAPGSMTVYDFRSVLAVLNPLPVVWKGDDARIKGGEKFGHFELSFDHDARPSIADGTMDPEGSGWLTDPPQWFVEWHGDGSGYISKAFHIWWSRNYGASHTNKPLIAPNSPALYFLTRSEIEDSDCAFVALNACARRLASQVSSTWSLDTHGVWVWRQAGELMSVLSRDLPTTFDSDDYEIRVNLDLLLSPKFNPFESEQYGNYPTTPPASEYTWKFWVNHIKMVHVPVKLELLDEEGNAVMHYRNAQPSPDSGQAFLMTLGCGHGEWAKGPASWCDMVLSYYKDGLSETAFTDGWVTNRPTLYMNPVPYLQSKEPTPLLAKREQGEYVPAPPRRGTLRLTVSDAVSGDQDTLMYLQCFDPELGMLNWRAYRDPKLTVVRKNRVNDDVSTESIKEVDVPGLLSGTFSESYPVGTHQKGVSPVSLGLLLDAAGNAVGKMVKNGVADTLLRHRLHALEDQFLGDHTALSGTAELNPYLLLLRSDASTPGAFLATCVRQNPIEDTEEITMAHVAEAKPRYTAAWSDPVCVQEPECYRYEWGDAVCVKVYVQDTVEEPNPED